MLRPELEVAVGVRPTPCATRPRGLNVLTIAAFCPENKRGGPVG